MKQKAKYNADLPLATQQSPRKEQYKLDVDLSPSLSPKNESYTRFNSTTHESQLEGL